MLTKIWSLIKLLKAGTYDQAMDAVLPVVLENKTVAPFLAKNKTVVGFILTVAYYALQTGVVTFPGAVWLPQAVAIAGVVLTALGIAHRGVKERTQAE